MSQWVRKGIETGIKTSRWPAKAELAAGVSPGLPVGGASTPDEITSLTAACPTNALVGADGEIVVDARRCVHCYRCSRSWGGSLEWSSDFEWARPRADRESLRRFGRRLGRSVHILVVDAGDCGACLHEVKLLNSPYYNMHRLGFFITPTPRHADILMVVGPVTDHMRTALQKSWSAMPEPKVVVAVGACALSGSVFGPSFASEGGVESVLPVDVEVPGHPPPPLAILYGLLVATGREPVRDASNGEGRG